MFKGDWVFWVKCLFLVYMGVERWLGRTKKIQANSVLDIVLNPIVGMLNSKSKTVFVAEKGISTMQVQNLKEVISALAAGVKVGLKIAEDKKVSVDDIPLLFQVIQKIPAAVADIDQVPGELADLDAAEAADLVAYTMAELALPEDHAKKIVESSMKVLISVYGLVLSIKG